MRKLLRDSDESGTTMSEADYKYWAFISYSHQDRLAKEQWQNSHKYSVELFLDA